MYQVSQSGSLDLGGFLFTDNYEYDDTDKEDPRSDPHTLETLDTDGL